MYKTGNENDYSFLLELDEFGNSDFRDANAIKESESSLSSDNPSQFLNHSHCYRLIIFFIFFTFIF